MKLIMILVSLMSFNALASEVSFTCSFSDIKYINQFSLSGTVEVTEGEFKNANFDFVLRKAGNVAQIENYSVTRDGQVQVFPAGSFYPYETKRVVSAEKGAELEYVNLLIDVPPLHSSQIRFLDGTTYFGSCRSH